MSHQFPNTPMMQQYLKLKKQYPNYLILFQLGDFYEFFYEDAEIAARILNLNLTKRQSSPMCGIPVHAKDNYVYKLLQHNYKVAICDQVDTKLVKKGNLVERAVAEIVTPGTFDHESLDASQSRLIACLWHKDHTVSFALLDIHTGFFQTGTFSSHPEECERLLQSTYIAELCYAQLPQSWLDTLSRSKVPCTLIPEYYFDFQEASLVLKNQFQLSEIDGLGLENSHQVEVSGACLRYVQYLMQKEHLTHISHLDVWRDEYLFLPESTLQTLEILHPAQSDYQDSSLRKHLQETKTAMGARMLAHWLTHPLKEKEPLEKRLQMVEEWFLRPPQELESLRKLLQSLPDLEKLLSRIALKKITPSQLLVFQKSLIICLQLQSVTQDMPHSSFPNAPLEKIKALYQWLHSCLEEEVSEQGSILKSGVFPDLDKIRQSASLDTSTLLEIEAKAQQDAKTNKLRLKHNKILGYYLEVPKKQIKETPPYFILKQNLVNVDRFTIPALLEIEQNSLSIKEDLEKKEQEIFFSLLDKITPYFSALKIYIDWIKTLDICSTFAMLSHKYHYVKPEISEGIELEIEEGRHPIIEKYTEQFSPNSLHFGEQDTLAYVITGPNMGGKSTFLRQTALIVLLAQIGCFVPAKKARIGLVDQIFTRIGSHDRLIKGQSTFLVEMSETSSILRQAKKRSLILLDELGRGTSTQDGLALSTSILQYLLRDGGTKSGKILFATHFHEIPQLVRHPRLKNLCVEAKHYQGNLVFMHQMKEGVAKSSYGIEVAALAGIPQEVIHQASQMIQNLEKVETLLSSSKIEEAEKKRRVPSEETLSLFEDTPHQPQESRHSDSLSETEKQELQLWREWKQEFLALDLENLSPLQVVRECERIKQKWEKKDSLPS